MPYNYNAFTSQYGNDTGLKRQEFRRLRGAMNGSGGDFQSYLGNTYGGPSQPTTTPPPGGGNGLVPSTAGFNPAAWFQNNGSRFNTRGMIGMLGDYYPHFQQMMGQYKDATNGVFSGMQNSPMWQAANNPSNVNGLMADTISPELLAQSIARGKDGIAMQGSQIEQEMRNCDNTDHAYERIYKAYLGRQT